MAMFVSGSSSSTGSFGMVGIGIASPGAKLDIKGGTDAYAWRVEDADSTGIRAGLYTHGPSEQPEFSMWDDTDQKVVQIRGWGTSYISGSSNFGIGTNNPLAQLHLSGSYDGGGYGMIHLSSTGAEGVVYAQGNVGIGNTAPPQPLTVEGNISGSGTGSFGVLKTGDIELENERGHWRIIEESEYLSIHNVKSGKKYKFVLEEIE